MKHFLIDDGWQKERGDWTPDPARFPDHGTLDGMAWMAQRIRDEGLIPGLWIAPFTVDRDGAFAKAHPGWLAPLGPLGAAFVPKNEAVLDLSNPEVLQWLRETFTRITGDWGYRWIKLDFSYYALFATGLSDARVTPSEAYRNAMDVVREAIGPDTFLVTISAMGLCFDVADGSRITLDNEPWWGDPESAGDQGIKVTYRTVARRYYLNHGLWINHPDLIFFRDGYGLTANEARAWASAVALTGGIVKLGETYTALHEHPDWRDVVHALLPVYPRTGRPLDLFAREYPELWDLKVEREGRKWDVVGLFHWGRNRDIGAASWEPELSRTRVLDLADLGLDPGKVHLAFDAWSRKWTWIEGGKKPYELAPRTATVLVIREKLPMPSIVFTTRHLLGGAVEVHGEAWDPASGRLTATLDTVPGEPITVYVATADRTAGKASADGATGLKGETADGVHALSFVAGAAATKVAIPFGP
jgi:alpha-galactosidase